VSFFNTELAGKRLAFLRELVPGAARVAVLVNPASAANTDITLKDVDTAARALGLQIQVFNASTSREIDGAFKALMRERPDALFVASDSFFTSRRIQLVNLAARYTLPASFAQREFVEVGGLMSYGTNLADMFRQVGVYTTAFSTAPGRRTCRWCSRPSSSWSSMPKPRGYSISRCRRRYSPPPTR